MTTTHSGVTSTSTPEPTPHSPNFGIAMFGMVFLCLVMSPVGLVVGLIVKATAKSDLKRVGKVGAILGGILTAIGAALFAIAIAAGVFAGTANTKVLNSTSSTAAGSTSTSGQSASPDPLTINAQPLASNPFARVQLIEQYRIDAYATDNLALLDKYYLNQSVCCYSADAGWISKGTKARLVLKVLTVSPETVVNGQRTFTATMSFTYPDVNSQVDNYTKTYVAVDQGDGLRWYMSHQS